MNPPRVKEAAVRLVTAQAKISGASFYIDDSAALNVPEMRAKAQRLGVGALDLELEIGDRAVEGVVLGPNRVGVDPGDVLDGRPLGQREIDPVA